jgi:hypothetical protein
MNKAVQIFLAFITIGFVAAAIVVTIQMLTGERPTAYLFPCFLMAGGLSSGIFAWNFGSDAGAAEICSSDDSDLRSPTFTAEAD